MTTQTDTYNYVQNPLGGTQYITISAAGLKSGATGANGSSSGTQDNVTAWAPSNYTFLPDQSAEITFANTPGANDWAGAAIRLSTTGGGQGYLAYYIPESSALFIGKMTAGTIGGGTSNSIGGVAVTFAAGDKLKVAVTGTTFTLYKNGTPLTTTPTTITDSSYSTGQPGLAYQFGNTDATLISGWSGVDAGGGSNTATIAWVV